MNAMDTTMAAPLTRRTVLKAAGAAGFASLLASLPLGASAQQAETIQDILNITTTTELFGVTVLGNALEANRQGRYTTPIPPPVVAILTAARAQEQFHIDFFRSLGGTPLTDTFTVPPALLTDSNLFFKTLVAQEAAETANIIGAFNTFVALRRADLVKTSFQYAAEESEHRLLANYAAGVRPANDLAFLPAMFPSSRAFLDHLRGAGIVGKQGTGAGTDIKYPGPGAIDPTNVLERTPGGPMVNCVAAAATATPQVSPIQMPTALPRTGGFGLEGVVQHLALMGLGAATAGAILRRMSSGADSTEARDE